MWSTFEVKKVQQIYEKLPEVSLEDILTPELIAVIKKDGGTAHENLRYIYIYIQFSCKTLQFRNYFFEPQHKQGLKTLRFVRLMTPDYNPGQFLKQLIKYLTVGVSVRVKIGFSFIGVQYQNGEPRFSYFFAAEDLCLIEGVFRKKQDLNDFADQIEKLQHKNFLNQTFLASKSGERFSNSGISPHILVASYFWIRK